MMKRLVRFIALIALSAPSVCFSQTMSDYLILNDIGVYNISKPEKLIPGFAPVGGPTEIQWSGVIAPTGHFQDHSDMTYEVMYLGGANNLPSPTVQVTQHPGGDSDQWLLHEEEETYRNGEYDTLGLLTAGSILRNIGPDRVFWIGLGGGDFLWLHDKIVIKISFTDLDGVKPEPLEIVQAYLQKFPSTIPATLVLDQAHDEKWIKDEMERRLWLGDKWFAWQAANNSDVSETLREVNRSLTIFLDYREKYYGVNADTDKETLFQLLSANDIQGMKNKLTEYKTWWTANKSGSISLP